MIGEIRQNFTEASASVGLILATALYTAKNLTSFGSYELIRTQIASIFGRKLKFINSFSLKIFFLAVRPK